MSNAYTRRFSLIALTLCLCLSVNSVAFAYLSVTHNMAGNSHSMDATADALSTHNHQPSVISAHDSSATVQHASTDNHAKPHKCCEDGKEACLSVSSDCAAHCTASIINATVFCPPMMMKTVFLKQQRFKDLSSADLTGLFKPPR